MFDINNYPKNYGSVKKDDFRLKDYSRLKEKELITLESDLWNVTNERLRLFKPITEYGHFKYLTSGWEFSVFFENENSLIKIPSGVFPEVNTKEYFNNIIYAYKLLQKYYPKRNIAETEFEKDLFIRQNFIKGITSISINEITGLSLLKNNLISFLQDSLELLYKENWLPFDIKIKEDNLVFINVIIDESSTPVIFDFTNPYDVYRLYEKRMKDEVKIETSFIKKLIETLQH